MWNLLWESRERREKVFTSPNSAQLQSQGKGTGNEVSLPHPTPLRCLPTILDKIKWNSKPPSPPNQGWSRAKGKNASFSHPWFGGEGGSRFSIYFVQDCNLGQNKMEQQTPIPPKSRMKPREGQKRAIFPSLIWGGEGGSRISIYFVQDCLEGV